MVEEKYFKLGKLNVMLGHYDRAIDFFEDCISINYTTPEVYAYLGVAHFFKQNFRDAYKFIQKAYLLAPDNPEITNIYAFLKLKENQVDEAVNRWYDLLEQHPGHRIAKKNLKKIKNCRDINKLATRAKPKDFLSFPMTQYFSMFALPAGISLLCIAVIFLAVKFIKIPSAPKIQWTLENITLPEIDDYKPDVSSQKYMFRYDAKTIKKEFNLCKKLLISSKANNAVIKINKILHSDAPTGVRQRFGYLLNFVKPPNDIRSDDNVDIVKIAKLPVIYEGVYIKWNGMATEVKNYKEKTEFKLLVGYQGGEKISGIAIVKMNGYYPAIVNNKKLTLIGKFTGFTGDVKYAIVEGFNVWELQ